MGVLGSAVAFITGSAVDVFYRRRVIEGTMPATGPVLLVANHPNGLLDPVVVQSTVLQTSGRRVRMLAKAPLFTMPGVSILVKGLDCLPVYRSKDGADTKQNAETFRAVEDALVGGSCVLIFPEGISHDEPSVQPLKTGAARMALAAVQKGVDLVVVPIGLSYADKLRFRSTAAVEIGAPIRVADFAAQKPASDDDDAERIAVKELTAAIYDAMKQLTVNLETWEDLPLLDAVDAIWRQDDPERTRRLKNLAAGTAVLRAHEPALFDELRARLSDWLFRLDKLGLRPHDVADGTVQARRDPKKLARFVVRNFAAAVFAFPIALFGAAFWFVPFWAVHLLFLIGRPGRDVGASVKVLAGMVFFPLWFVAVVVAVGLWASPLWALLLVVVAPGAGMTTRHFFRRRFFAVQQLGTFLQLGFRGKLVDDLIRERDGFCREFDAVAARVETLTVPAGAASGGPV
ncbi:MAG: 1-acyl-sn-glycerol-3-phosphate acyltransferase [Deltaproteobacteria bacterium]|nr:1-acyl-sn-glycerol-3-phosphate acyltransferase [Deltaproteobacteria bacterium]